MSIQWGYRLWECKVPLAARFHIDLATSSHPQSTVADPPLQLFAGTLLPSPTAAWILLAEPLSANCVEHNMYFFAMIYLLENMFIKQQINSHTLIKLSTKVNCCTLLDNDTHNEYRYALYMQINLITGHIFSKNSSHQNLFVLLLT